MAYIGVQPTDTYLSIASQQITGTGSATYTLDYSVSTEEDVAVFVNNVRQNVSSYTVSGTSLTLGGTISASDSCWVLFLGRTVGTKTPAVGSVTNDMLAGSIANAKLANSSITLNGTAVSLGGSATVGGSNTPAFEAYLGSNQTVSSGVHTKISLDNTTINTGNDFDTSTYKFTCSEEGTYFFIGNLRANSSSSYQLATNIPSIYKNGVQIRQSYNHMNSSNAPSNVESKTVHTVVSLSVSDYIEFYGNIATYAGTPTINATDTYFQGFKLIG